MAASKDAGRDGAGSYPDDPVLARIWRGERVESQHRGAWVLVDGSGSVLDGEGGYDAPFFARSSVKCLQALPLLETGAADAYGFSQAELALALASHDGEACHTDGVRALLARLGLDASHLQCGPHPPGGKAARAELARRGEAPSRLHNNCSGKHAGFLALALHLGVPVERYLDPEGEAQRLVRAALVETSGVDERDLYVAIDGCSAPTFRLPLTALATAFARVATPDGLGPERRAACERILAAAAAHPVLIGGSEERLCTDLLRVSGGALFPKIGAEAVYVIGVRGKDRALALKVDDGAGRALHPVVLGLLERLGLVGAAELERLGAWRAGAMTNWAGLEVGRLEVCLGGA